MSDAGEASDGELASDNESRTSDHVEESQPVIATKTEQDISHHSDSEHDNIHEPVDDSSMSDVAPQSPTGSASEPVGDEGSQEQPAPTAQQDVEDDQVRSPSPEAHEEMEEEQDAAIEEQSPVAEELPAGRGDPSSPNQEEEDEGEAPPDQQQGVEDDGQVRSPSPEADEEMEEGEEQSRPGEEAHTAAEEQSPVAEDLPSGEDQISANQEEEEDEETTGGADMEEPTSPDREEEAEDHPASPMDQEASAQPDAEPEQEGEEKDMAAVGQETEVETHDDEQVSSPKSDAEPEAPANMIKLSEQNAGLFSAGDDSDDDDDVIGRRHTQGPSRTMDSDEEPTTTDKPEPELRATQSTGSDDGTDNEGITKEGLFGDDDDLSSSSGEEEGGDKAKDQEGMEDGDEPVGRFPGEEDEEEPEEPQETVIDVEMPRVSLDLGNQIHFLKFPNFLSVEPRPFDPETYEDDEEDEILDEEGRSRLKLRVENTIRWRNSADEDGGASKESNAKIVRWSDGSMSLHLGTEIFDVHLHPLQGDHNHLFIRLGTGLQAQAVFRTKLTFRPHSTDSFTHRKMTLSMADRSNKSQKVKILANVGTDPEARKQDLIKKEEEKLRASARREAISRRMKERQQQRGMSASYLEERDNDDGQGPSLSAIKRKYKGSDRSKFSTNEGAPTTTRDVSIVFRRKGQ